jgi:signal transduction histidine kinase
LEDVLTLDRNDSNKIKVTYVPVDLHVFIPALIGEVEGAYANTHVVNITWKSAGDVLLISDVNLLRHIFVNLLGNAIKFSPAHKEVQFCVEEKEHAVVFTVADRGIGICADDKSKIFEAFHRGENTSAIQGTGLGLNIVKHAVDLLGGEILVTSEPGKGSTFLVKIPKLQ